MATIAELAAAEQTAIAARVAVEDRIKALQADLDVEQKNLEKAQSDEVVARRAYSAAK